MAQGERANAAEEPVDAPSCGTATIRWPACTRSLRLAGRVESIRLAVEDQQQMFGDRYPRANASLARMADVKGQVDARLAPSVGRRRRRIAGRARIVGRRRQDAVGNPAGQPAAGLRQAAAGQGAARVRHQLGRAQPLGQRDGRPVARPARRQADHDPPAARVSDMDLHWDGRADPLLRRPGAAGRSTSTAAACGASRPKTRRSPTTTPATCPTARSSSSRTPASRPCPARAAATWATCT